jgi:concanavalin A-like lectin/glucanase superfamily protein
MKNSLFGPVGRVSVLALGVAGAALAGAGLPARGALIQYIGFDGNSNATVGTNGTPFSPTANPPTFVADRNGAPNSAVAFNGSTTDQQSVNVAGGGGLNNLQVGTMAFFVRWNGTQSVGLSPTTWGTVTARQGNGLFSEDVVTLDGADPATAKIDFRLAGAFANAVVSTVSPGNGVWHHIAVTFNTATPAQQMYIDGVLNATGTAAGTIHDNAGVALSIGAWIGDGKTWSASNVDDFRVYDSVLTGPEILALATAPTPEPGAIGGIVCATVGMLARRGRRGA